MERAKKTAPARDTLRGGICEEIQRGKSQRQSSNKDDH
jgi:hypothetical protein